jgi:uncharacterized protein (DUF433 family)
MGGTQVAIGHIELRANRDGSPRAYICGTRIRVQDIVSDHERHGLSPEEIAREYLHLSLAQVHAALAYYYDHRDEIREQMKADADYVRGRVV